MDNSPDRRGNENTIVYLVDDDRGMVASTSQWLTLSGLKVRAFADPTALIRVLKAGEPCVVVSDIRMPEIDGLELMRLVQGRDRRIPVILITGHGDIPLAVEAMKLGAYEFLQKPFSPEELVKTVRKAMPDYRGETTGNENPATKPAIPQVKTGGSGEPVGDDTGCNQLSGRVDAYEKELIEAALRRHGGSISKTIEELDIPRRTLNAKMRKHGIDRADFR